MALKTLLYAVGGEGVKPNVLHISTNHGHVNFFRRLRLIASDKAKKRSVMGLASHVQYPIRNVGRIHTTAMRLVLMAPRTANTPMTTASQYHRRSIVAVPNGIRKLTKSPKTKATDEGSRMDMKTSSYPGYRLDSFANPSTLSGVTKAGSVIETSHSASGINETPRILHLLVFVCSPSTLAPSYMIIRRNEASGFVVRKTQVGVSSYTRPPASQSTPDSNAVSPSAFAVP